MTRILGGRVPIDRFLIAASLAWLVAVIVCPNLADTKAAFCVTVCFLGINLLISVRTLIQEKRILVLLNLVQVVLFVALHFQIFETFGTNHYRYESHPTLLDWSLFVGAHAVHAADLLDAIDEYGVDLQPIKHSSILSGLALVALHVVADVFVLGLIGAWIMRRRSKLDSKQQSQEKELECLRERYGKNRLVYHGALLLHYFRLRRLGLMACIPVYVGFALQQNWHERDWFLWPVDNILRTLDVADAMQIFDWRLHGVPTCFGLESFAIVFRLFCGAYIVEAVLFLHLRLLGPKSLRTIDALLNDLRSENEAVRRVAATLLGQIQDSEKVVIPCLVQALSDQAPPVRQAAAEALGKIEASDESVHALVNTLVDYELSVRQAASDSLVELGPQSAIPVTQAFLAVSSASLNGVAAETLCKLGPSAKDGVPALIDALKDERYWSGQIISILAAIGGPAVPGLLQLMRDGDNRAQRLAKDGLKAVGSSAIPALVEVLKNDKAPRAREAAAKILRGIAQTAQLAQGSGQERLYIGNNLLDPQRFARIEAAVPALLQGIIDEDNRVRHAAKEALHVVMADWHTHPQYIQQALSIIAPALANPDRYVRQSALKALLTIGRPSVPRLIEAAHGENLVMRESAIRALDDIVPTWRDHFVE